MILHQLGIAVGMGQMDRRKERTTSPATVGNDYNDGMGKMNNAPDDRYNNELVHPAGARPDWSEYGQDFTQPIGDWRPKTAKEMLEEQHRDEAAYQRKGRQFRITEADSLGERNKLFDEED